MIKARAAGPERSRRAVLRGLAGVAMAGFALPFPAFAQYEPGLPAAIQAAARGDREVAAFYEGRRYRPLWVKGGEIGAEAEQVLRLLETADADGLNPRTYRVPALVEAIRESYGSPRALARAEVLLSRTFAAYVQDVRRFRDMGVVYAEAHFRPIVPTRTVILESAAAASDLQLHLDSIGWMNPMYAQLRGALAAQGSDEERPLVHIPAGPILRPGSTDPRVRLLRARLGLMPEGRYDNAVVNAVRALQRAHGMPVDGIAGPLTVALLNQGSPQQRQLLRLNLERARALPAQLGRRYVLVDAAAARLWMYEDGEVRDSMRVVVGKPSEPTPMMAAMLRSVTLNPYWNIPPDLVRSRVAPGAAREGAAFLRARRYEILSDWTDNAELVSPASVNWAAVASGRQELRVRQLPGRDNAMGRMKFNFPNEHGIYLHDTPDRNLLREEGRLFSSGCVRVEDAPRLARWLFGRMPTARGSEPEQQIALPEPVPVYITYLTVAPEPQGVATRPDVYNRDPAQLAALDRRPGRRSR
jgi:murein L,D-transpeptidase YcbB/YkuD